MLTCAECKVRACKTGRPDDMPVNCPMRRSDLYGGIRAEYEKEENKELTIQSAAVEKDGYGNWNRVRETIELCKRMGYKKVGLAFCVGLGKEGATCARIFREKGLEVESICCKNGAFDKTDLGIAEDKKLRPGQFEAACDPVGQARFLADAGVDIFVVLGLCVGHDSLFIRYASRYSDAPVTVLVSKDRATGNNPCAALYCADGYFKHKFNDENL